MKLKYKNNYIVIILIASLCVVASCNNDNIKVVKGTPVNSVSYSIRPAQDTDINSQNPIVTYLPKGVYNALGVPYVKPYRKGFDFVSYSDGVNTYKEGDIFTKDTVKDGEGNVSLTVNFTPSSAYFTKKKMFTLTKSEIENTSLKSHAQKKEGSSPRDIIDISFVTFPGGYVLNVPNTPGVKTSYSVGNPDYSAEIAGFNKGVNGNDVSSWVVEDFAIATSEVPSALFKMVLDWNDKENKGYEFGFERNISGSLAVSDNTYPYYGAYYNNGKYYNRNSAYDPVCFVPYDSAIVFCNALTEWYNEKYGASLTTAYTIDGRQSGAPIKSVHSHSNYIIHIDTLSSADNESDKKALLPENAQLIPHVQGATGFRLPTSSEWIFASVADPKGTDKYASSHISGYIYPDMVKHNNISGALGISETDEGVYRRAVSSPYYSEASDFPDNGTQKAGIKTVLTPSKSEVSAIANLSEIYDMSGNVAEWIEGLKPVSSDGTSGINNALARTVWGGSFATSFEDNVPSNYQSALVVFSDKNISENVRSVRMDKPNIGIRLCRTVNSETVSIV